MDMKWTKQMKNFYWEISQDILFLGQIHAKNNFEKWKIEINFLDFYKVWIWELVIQHNNRNSNLECLEDNTVSNLCNFWSW